MAGSVPLHQILRASDPSCFREPSSPLLPTGRGQATSTHADLSPGWLWQDHSARYLDAGAPPGNSLVAWVSLDEAVNDPVHFWSYVLTALDRVQPGKYSGLIAYLQSEVRPSPHHIMTACLNRLLEHPEPLILILDDYHMLTDETVHTGLSAFIEHLPYKVCVMLSTRADPPLPLSSGGSGQAASIDLFPAPLRRELEDMALARVRLAQHKTDEALMRLVPLLESSTKSFAWSQRLRRVLVLLLLLAGSIRV